MIKQMETKRFDLRDILTVTTGRLLTKATPDGFNGIDKLYAILDWMTGDEVFTHQLGRFSKECKPYLLQWFPELAQADGRLDRLDELVAADLTKQKQEAVSTWLTELKAMFPALKDVYEVPKIPRDDHDVIDPLTELIDMRGSDNDIIVI